MKAKINGAFFAGLISCLVLSAWADGPTISDVVVRQRWPWSRLVNIDYTLNCEAGKSMDVRLSAFDGTNVLTLPECSLSGGLNGVSNGVQRIVWNPLKTAYTNQALMRFNVDLAVTNTPLYVIVDLAKTNAPDQVKYLYESDLTSGAYGAVATNPIPGVASLVWTGVTNDAAYATNKLVLRRVPAGSYKMQGTLAVTLTKPFYVGVFEVTQRQWELVMGIGQKPSSYNNATWYMTRPVESMQYNTIRGATNDTPAVNWPITDRTVVTAGSFMGRLRSLTGIGTLDLPTEAQWEYACRAGTTTVFNDGNASADVAGANAYTNAWLGALGRYKFGGGYLADGVTPPLYTCAPTNGTALVGSYLPNGWGLYDMHGNVQEYCLDWLSSPVGGVDTAGPRSTSDSKRVLRGGGAFDPANGCPSYSRNGTSPLSAGARFGFRLVWTLP
jgi:formylglycine-generating enzyme required for sulfatase activity